MKNIITISLLFLGIVLCDAQSEQLSGEQLRKEGKLIEAIEAYKKEYAASKDRKVAYDLACVFALSYQKDSAFHYLKIALKEDQTLWTLADTDLLALTDDARWLKIADAQMKRYQTANGPLKAPEYAQKLLALIQKDQALDYYIDLAKMAYMKEGEIPHWYFPLGAYKQQIGGNNFETLQQLLKDYGWPKYSTVGQLAADAPLLIINHHESDAVRVEYLPQIKKACMEKEGSCMEYAKIQDRILVNSNKPQIYGMQFRYNAKRKLEPFPIQDPEYVDQRRFEIGLEPLKDYLKRKINYDWTVEQKDN